MAKIQNKQRIELLVRIEEAFVYRRLRPDGQTYTVSGLKQLIQEARKFNSETEQKLPQLQIDISVFEEELPYLEKEEIQARIEEALAYMRANPAGETYTVSGLKQLIQEARKFNSETEQKLPQLQIDISVFEEELPYLEKEEIQARIEEALAYMRANPAGETYTVSGLKQLIQEARKFNSETEQKLPLWRRKK